jgi:hypothetical protein
MDGVDGAEFGSRDGLLARDASTFGRRSWRRRSE